MANKPRNIAKNILFAFVVCAVFLVQALPNTAIAANATNQKIQCRVIRAEVVALDEAIVINRYGAFNPSGMLYALKDDVMLTGLKDQGIPDNSLVTEANIHLAPGHVRLREGKRPRPLVLRANEGDCLEVKFHNLLMKEVNEERSGGPVQYGGKVPAHMEERDGVIYPTKDNATGRNLVIPTAISNDLPRTRAASFHITGLDVVPVTPSSCPLSTKQHEWLCGTDGTNVGLSLATVNPKTPEPLKSRLQQQGGQVYPGQSAIYRMYAFREGTYFAYSTAASVGGEGDGGQLGAGLFGAVNVEPKGAKWYRSQVTHKDLEAALKTKPSNGHPYRFIDYDGARYQNGKPILAMLNKNEIVHSDLNAVIVLPDADETNKDSNDTTNKSKPCSGYVDGNSCGKSYREFTVIMHDEVKVAQAFAELEDENNPIHYIKDGMGINYGVGGMGAMVMARNRKVGPLKNCPECRAEEFFLSSWANGDPALILEWDKDGKQPTGALYPDDPSNVHHSYLNDPVRFRNIHAGPKETHVFHLHAHQWVMDASAPGSTYLDSQTISPGATFSYEIEFGGSGNRNLSPGDSIFHCHLYPHFAQGMWELWRTHDVFENGDDSRKLPDAEVKAGIENPAIVPIPGTALPLMPTEDFKGYPFYVAGEPGHRQPQPPLDMDQLPSNNFVDGGMPRHVLKDGVSANPAQQNTTKLASAVDPVTKKLANQDVIEEALRKGGKAAQINAARVYEQNPEALRMLAETWDQLGAVDLLPEQGTPAEIKAMQFHSGKLNSAGFKPVTGNKPHPDWRQEKTGYSTYTAQTVSGQKTRPVQDIFWVNGREPAAGAPFADPCPTQAHSREYRASVLQTELTVNRHGWFDPQARILALEDDVKDIIDPNNRDRLPEPLFFRANSGDCITFKHTNLAPNALGLDDFQIYTPTDTVGQHIHLVKFDVTSSDGSGNGFNYEDGTFSPEEVRERVWAYNKAKRLQNAPASELLALKTHPMFAELQCGTMATKEAERCIDFKAKGTCPENTQNISDHETWQKIGHDHPFCGAQRTVQRWYADPIFDPKTGKDYTLRTVFTHDHFGPSSHQQHGLYAALIVEPSNSVWLNLANNGISDDAGGKLDWSKLCSSNQTEKAAERAKLIGGANLSADFDAECKSVQHKAVGVNEIRPALKLRQDGGPTATRANIVAPKCLVGQPLKGARMNSNPLDPASNAAKTSCNETLQSNDTRREYAVAFADFSVLYNTALEPINPEERDISALRFGRRQVPTNLPKPLAISSEDPGTQLINYRNEPLPLRIADIKPDPTMGGFDYTQKKCDPTDVACTGDMANVFSTSAHENRDKKLATEPYGAVLSPAYQSMLNQSDFAKKEGLNVKQAMADIESWRKDFNCALYPASVISGCKLKQLEPWRQMGDPATPILPVYEGDRTQIRLIQGAQEAQHVFAMTDSHWLREPDNPNSGYTNAQPLGISEHFEMNVNVSPKPIAFTDQLYMGSSIDQLWDGMWGIMRAYGKSRINDGQQYNTQKQQGVAQLYKVAGHPTEPPTSQISDNNMTVCIPNYNGNNTSTPTVYESKLNFDISVVRACDLTDTCGKAGQKGIAYNQRIGMDDPNAIVFVRNNRLPNTFGKDDSKMNALTNTQILDKLRGEIEAGKRKIEPLVLRAPAGACMQVKVRNHLPAVLPDGTTIHGVETTNHFSDNFMSMITDGFNYNQFRMSSSVGLSAPMIAKYTVNADGANYGLNSQFGSGAGQGNLVKPCKAGDTDKNCKSADILWWAGDYALDAKGVQKNLPHEFGAIPLFSTGDVIKHPAHGAVGALVIGPENSYRCKPDDLRELESDKASDISATMCMPNGKKYRDFVLVLQDAVDAKIKGDRVANLKGAEEPDDYGIKAANYRTQPLWAHGGGDPSIEFEERNEFDYTTAHSAKLENSKHASVTPKNAENLINTIGFKEASKQVLCQSDAKMLLQKGRGVCDTESPIFVATAGHEIRMRVVHPGGHTRQQAITVDGHDWDPYPWKEGSMRLNSSHEEAVKDSWIIQGSYNSIGPMMAANLLLHAGGRSEVPADYLWRSQASFPYDGGLWGILRVLPKK